MAPGAAYAAAIKNQRKRGTLFPNTSGSKPLPPVSGKKRIARKLKFSRLNMGGSKRLPSLPERLFFCRLRAIAANDSGDVATADFYPYLGSDFNRQLAFFLIFASHLAQEAAAGLNHVAF